MRAHNNPRKASTRKRRDKTMEQKAAVLVEFDSSGATAAARKFGIDRRHVYKIRDQRKKIQDAIALYPEYNQRKRFRKATPLPDTISPGIARAGEISDTYSANMDAPHQRRGDNSTRDGGDDDGGYNLTLSDSDQDDFVTTTQDAIDSKTEDSSQIPQSKTVLSVEGEVSDADSMEGHNGDVDGVSDDTRGSKSNNSIRSILSSGKQYSLDPVSIDLQQSSEDSLNNGPSLSVDDADTMTSSHQEDNAEPVDSREGNSKTKGCERREENSEHSTLSLSGENIDDGRNKKYDQHLRVTDNPIKPCSTQTLIRVSEPMNKHKEMEPPIIEITLTDQVGDADLNSILDTGNGNIHMIGFHGKKEDTSHIVEYAVPAPAKGKVHISAPATENTHNTPVVNSRQSGDEDYDPSHIIHSLGTHFQGALKVRRQYCSTSLQTSYKQQSTSLQSLASNELSISSHGSSKNGSNMSVWSERSSKYSIRSSAIMSVGSGSAAEAADFLMNSSLSLTSSSSINTEMKDIPPPVDAINSNYSLRIARQLVVSQKKILRSITQPLSDYSIVRISNYKGDIYVADQDQISRVSSDGEISVLFKYKYYVDDVAVSNDRVFVLGLIDGITVYSLSGEYITKWTTSHQCDSITTAGELLVLGGSGSLLVYTKTGRLVKSINITASLYCPSLYRVDSVSVIVIGFRQKRLLRFNITPRQVMWKRDDITARSAVSDGRGYLYVRDGDDRIHILDVKTGLTLDTIDLEMISIGSSPAISSMTITDEGELVFLTLDCITTVGTLHYMKVKYPALRNC